MSGASYPCKSCGMSHRNSVHLSPLQYGYHAYIDPDPEAEPERTYTQSELDAKVAAARLDEAQEWHKHNGKVMSHGPECPWCQRIESLRARCAELGGKL